MRAVDAIEGGPVLTRLGIDRFDDSFRLGPEWSRWLLSRVNKIGTGSPARAAARATPTDSAPTTQLPTTHDDFSQRPLYRSAQPVLRHRLAPDAAGTTPTGFHSAPGAANSRSPPCCPMVNKPQENLRDVSGRLG